MTGVLLRIIVFAAIGLFIMYGVRKIWRDWTGKFKADEDDAYRRRRERDLSERQRPDVIDLKRDDDGTFRPKDGDRDRR